MGKAVELTQKWVEGIKKGDEQAAYHIYQQYSRSMYNLLCRLCGDSELAQDLLQEAFVQAFSRIKSFRGEASFGAWLKRIVVNTGLQHLRNKKMYFEEVEQVPDVPAEEEVLPALDRKKIHQAIKELPERCRIVVTLYLIEDYSHKEIAEQLEISESTSKTQYKRGKELLRISLKKIIDEGR